MTARLIELIIMEKTLGEAQFKLCALKSRARPSPVRYRRLKLVGV